MNEGEWVKVKVHISLYIGYPKDSCSYSEQDGQPSGFWAEEIHDLTYMSCLNSSINLANEQRRDGKGPFLPSAPKLIYSLFSTLFPFTSSYSQKPRWHPDSSSSGMLHIQSFTETKLGPSQRATLPVEEKNGDFPNWKWIRDEWNIEYLSKLLGIWVPFTF